MSKAAIDINNLPYADGDFFAFEQLLSGKEQDRLAEVREFLAREVKPIAVDCWNRGEFPMELIPKLAEIDLVSPVRRQGYSNLFAGILHAEATRADTSIATFMGVHDGLFTGSIEALASQEQQDAWLPDIYSLKKIGAFGLTEPLGGSDVAGGTRTTARREGDNWILNGAKRWIGNATFSDWVVIYARDVDDNQVKGFLVDTSDRGLQRHEDREQDLAAHGPERRHHARQRGGAGLLQARQRQQLPRHQQGPEGHPPRRGLAGGRPAARRPSTSPGATPWSAASSAARLPPSSWSSTSSCRSSATRSARWA